MRLRNKVLAQALKWRIAYLNSKYDYRDDKFILEHNYDSNLDWLDALHRRDHERDVIMGKIKLCQDILDQIKEETPNDIVSVNDKVVSVLFLAFIALSCYGLIWFNEILK